jgi:hypothetical protein
MTSVSAANRSSSTSAPSLSHLLATPDMAKAFKAMTKGLAYESESEYPYAFTAAKDNGKGVNANNVMHLFYGELKRKVFTDPDSQKGVGITKYSAKDMKEMLKSISEPVDGDAQGTADAKKAGQAMNMLVNNMSEVSMFKVGPRDSGTHTVTDSEGLYAFLLMGKTKDGKIAGTYFGSVET